MHLSKEKNAHYNPSQGASQRDHIHSLPLHLPRLPTEVGGCPLPYPLPPLACLASAKGPRMPPSCRWRKSELGRDSGQGLSKSLPGRVSILRSYLEGGGLGRGPLGPLQTQKAIPSPSFEESLGCAHHGKPPNPLSFVRSLGSDNKAPHL